MKGILFTEHRFMPGEIQFENGLITKITPLDESKLLPEERNTYILPGLVDIHLHGAAGVDTCECDGSHGPQMLQKFAEYEIASGVTSFCPTTMTYDEGKLTNVVEAVRDFKESSKEYGDAIVGIHLEGPFISHDKCGAQNPKYIQSPDYEMLMRLQKASGNLIKQCDIAPDADGAIAFIRKCFAKSQTEPSCHISLAHTNADYVLASEAFASGADHVTHLYNAMPPFLNRAPGVVGAAYDHKDTYVELICDGIHIHPTVIRATFAMFAGRVVMISDSMEACGMPDGKYFLGGLDVYVQGSLATQINGTIAGSVTNLFACMRNVIEMGIAPEIAVDAASLIPAKSIGLDSTIGSIAVGKRADLLLCTRDFELKQVIRNR